MEYLEGLKAAMSECPITIDITYSEDVDKFIMRYSMDGVVLGIITVPEEAFVQIMGNAIKDEETLVQEQVEFYENPEI